MYLTREAVEKCWIQNREKLRKKTGLNRKENNDSIVITDGKPSSFDSQVVPIKDCSDPVELVEVLLLAKAEELRSGRTAPSVSQFHVECVALMNSGEAYFGVNVEFPGFPLNETIHAEQFTIAHIFTHVNCPPTKACEGQFKDMTQCSSKISHLALFVTPCGHCRQFLNELASARNIKVVLCKRPQSKILSHEGTKSPFKKDHRGHRHPTKNDQCILAVDKQDTQAGSEKDTPAANNEDTLATSSKKRKLSPESQHSIVLSLSELLPYDFGPHNAQIPLNKQLLYEPLPEIDLSNNNNLSTLPLPTLSSHHEQDLKQDLVTVNTVSKESNTGACTVNGIGSSSLPLHSLLLRVTAKSYSPYTNYYSGVLLVTKNAYVYAGAYIESAAFNPSLAPLQTAIVNLFTQHYGQSSLLFRTPSSTNSDDFLEAPNCSKFSLGDIISEIYLMEYKKDPALINKFHSIKTEGMMRFKDSVNNFRKRFCPQAKLYCFTTAEPYKVRSMQMLSGNIFCKRSE
eukprot:g4268.t1